MADDAARIEISATSSRLEQGLRTAAAQVKRWAVGIQSIVSKAGSSAMKGGREALTGGGAIGKLAGRGMDFVADQAIGVKTFEESLVRLQIAGGLAADKVDAVRQAARKSSSELGIGADKLLEGTQAYVDLTGDVNGATTSMRTFGRIAQASGTEVADVATAAAAFKGAGVPLEQMETTFSGLIAQGKMGAVSLKDFAGELSAIMPRWAKLTGGTSATGIAEMGASFQIARQGFKSASGAVVGLEATLGGLMGHQFAKTGIKIWNKDNKTGERSLKSMSEILDAIAKSDLAKNPDKLREALGSKEAEQAVTMLLKARQHTQGQASEFDKLAAAGRNATAVQEDLDTYLNSSSGKMGKSWEMVKNKIAEAFTPERIEKFAKVMEHVVAAIEAVLDRVGKTIDFWTGKDDDTNLAAAEMAIGSEGNTSTLDPSGIMGGIAKRVMGVDDTTNSYEQDNAIETIRQIKAGGDRAERVKRALAASSIEDNASVGGSGWGPDAQSENAAANRRGARRAGKAALDAMGISEAQAQKMRDDALRKALEDMGSKIAEAINSKPNEVSIDGNKADAALKKSTNARKSP